MRRPRWLVPGVAVAAVLVALGAAAWWWEWAAAGDRATASRLDPRACAPPAAGEGWSRIALNSDPTAQEQLSGGSLRFEVQDAHWRASGEGWQVVLTTSMQNQTSEPEYHGSWRYQYLVVAQRSFSEVTCFSGGSVPVDAGLVDDALIGFQVGCKPVGAIEVVLEDDKGEIRVTKELAPGAC